MHGVRTACWQRPVGVPTRNPKPIGNALGIAINWSPVLLTVGRSCQVLGHTAKPTRVGCMLPNFGDLAWAVWIGHNSKCERALACAHLWCHKRCEDFASVFLAEPALLHVGGFYVKEIGTCNVSGQNHTIPHLAQ